MSPPCSARPRERIAQGREILRENLTPLRAVEAEGCERRRIATGADAEFQPAVGQKVEHGRVLRDTDRLFERQRDDAGAEADGRRARGHMREEHQRRRQSTFGFVEMVLGDPCRVEPAAFGMSDLLRREPVSLRRRRLIEHAREKAEALGRSLWSRHCCIEPELYAASAPPR